MYLETIPARLLQLIALTLALSLAPFSAAAAQDTATVDEVATQLDEFLHSVYLEDEAGAAVIVTRDGEVLFRDAYGMANLELGVPLEPDMVFRLGSVTKQFTAAAILLLEERGQLSVDDSITKFLPDYPTQGHEITVAHLLAHTSGIRSYTSIPGWMQIKIKRDLSLKNLIKGFADESMDFAPGEEFRYNNSGYVLLGAVIEEASGKKYEDFIDEEIFQPLEMSSSYYGSHARVIPRRVAGYDGGPGNYWNSQYLSMTQPHAAGSLLSSVDDLAKWDAALYTDALLSSESRKKQIVPFALNSGESTGYAYGFMIGKLRGRQEIHHGGGIFGFSTFALRLPEERLYVAVLTNDSGRRAEPGYVARKLAAIVIGDPFPDRTEIELAESILDEYTGVYRIDESSTRTVTRVGKQLFAKRSRGSKMQIRPETEKLFFYEESFTYLTFERDDNGAVTHMLLYPNGSDVAERADLVRDPVPGDGVKQEAPR